MAPGAGDRRLLRLVCEMIRARSSCFCFFVFLVWSRSRSKISQGEFFFFFFDVPPLAFDHPESFSTVPLCSRFLDYEGNKSLSPAAIKRKKDSEARATAGRSSRKSREMMATTTTGGHRAYTRDSFSWFFSLTQPERDTESSSTARRQSHLDVLRGQRDDEEGALVGERGRGHGVFFWTRRRKRRRR